MYRTVPKTRQTIRKSKIKFLDESVKYFTKKKYQPAEEF